VDCAGNIFTAIRNTDNSDSPVKLQVKAAASIVPEGWATEIAIPFSALGINKKPNDDTQWKFNTTRTRRAAGRSGEPSSWAKLDLFSQQNKFAHLIFYANPEIEADLAFWENNNRSGLMDRSEVSGIKFASKIAGKEPFPTLWDYSPFVKQNKPAKSWSMRGLTPGTKEKYPEMHRAATKLNSLLIDKSFLDEQLNELCRADLPSKEFASFLLQSKKLNSELNGLYQAYGRAYKSDKNKMPAALFSNMDKVKSMIKELKSACLKKLEIQQKNARKKIGDWQAQSLKPTLNEKYMNCFGYSRRYQFAAHEFFSNTDSLLPLGPFSSHTLHSNYVSSSPTQKDANASWDYSFLQIGLNKQKNSSIKRIYSRTTLGQGDLCTVMLPEIKSKPGVYMSSVDKLPPYTKFKAQIKRASNIHNNTLNNFIDKYIKGICAEIRKSGIPVDYYMIGWEGKNKFKVTTKENKKEYRSMGFTSEGKDYFHEYLKERYASLKELNKFWQTNYKSFGEINPQNDKFINPLANVTGLSFEHERWTRVTYLRWLKGIKNSFHKNAPGIPVMEDMSYFLIDGNTYLAFKENIADIMSFHTNPLRELAMWNFMYSINRSFGKLLGYYENYWGMFRRKYLNNERFAKREVDKFFFELFMHDISISAWWLRYHGSSGTYLAGYNCNPFYLDYGQTIFRWSTTSLPVMFKKGLSIEKMLLDTKIAKSKNAMIQPCTSVFALSSLGYTVYNSPPITMLFDLHNNLLRPKDIPYEFLPEEMVLDKKASLNEYECLILPYAPYMTLDFSRQLKSWVKQGGTLIAFGPFAIYNEAGKALRPEDSLLKTLFPKVTIGSKLWDFSLSGKDEPPMVSRKAFGKGKLLIFNSCISVCLQNANLKSQLDEVFSREINKPVFCADENLRSIIRTGKNGSQWLAINNTSASKPIHTKVSVYGEFKRVYDVMIPGWMPLKTSVDNGKTKIDIALRPGDWTVLKLK